METIDEQIELHKKKLNEYIEEIIVLNDMIRKCNINNNINIEQEFLESLITIKMSIIKGNKEDNHKNIERNKITEEEINEKLNKKSDDILPTKTYKNKKKNNSKKRISKSQDKPHKTVNLIEIK